MPILPLVLATIASRIAPFPNSPLPVILVDGDSHAPGTYLKAVLQNLEKSLANVARQELRRRVGHRQQAAAGSRENPPPIVEHHLHFPLVWAHAHPRVMRGQQHTMIQLRRDRFQAWPSAIKSTT